MARPDSTGSHTLEPTAKQIEAWELYWKGLSIRQVARALEIAPSTAQQRLEAYQLKQTGAINERRRAMRRRRLERAAADRSGGAGRQEEAAVRGDQERQGPHVH